jgi:membrane protein EpsK
MGVLNLILAIVLATFFGWGVYGVAIAGAVVLTAKNALFTPIYAAIITGQSWYVFIKSLVPGLALLAALTGFGYIPNYYLRPMSWATLVLLSLAVVALGLIGVWVLLSTRDRRLIIDLVPDRIRSLAMKLITT